MTVLKCQIRPSSRLNNKKIVFEFCTFQMSRSEIRRKYTADAVQLHRISHPASHPYKEGPHVKGNGASTQDALEDKDKIQRINHSAKDQHKWLTGGVGRPLGSAEPGLQCVHVHLREESRPRHLVTFHMCFWREPTSRAINRASLSQARS